MLKAFLKASEQQLADTFEFGLRKACRREKNLESKPP